MKTLYRGKIKRIGLGRRGGRKHIQAPAGIQRIPQAKLVGDENGAALKDEGGKGVIRPSRSFFFSLGGWVNFSEL